ncbi:efflux RND transporter permease subunit, partial [Burkholderia pseudomallei]|uniref:efflux RND transporter permease subunit n=1 Tax=Burkholderia pseudomallei TaxID=28450 RepID=UPI0015E17681
PGYSTGRVEPTTRLPALTLHPGRGKLARYGVTVGDVQDTVSAAVRGRKAGLLFQGDRRFEIVGRLPDELRTDVEAIKRLPIALPLAAPAGARGPRAKAPYVPTDELAPVDTSPGPHRTNRQASKHRTLRTASVHRRRARAYSASAPASR